MTELQIKAQQLAETRRHDIAMEQAQKEQNQYNREHYERSDTITGEHYERSDKASMVSANASAMNAQAAVKNAETNRLNYQLQHDIEYLPTITVDGNTYDQVITGYGQGLPLSAQKKLAEIENLTLNSSVVMVPDVVTSGSDNVIGYNRDSKGNWTPQKVGEARNSGNYNVKAQKDSLNATIFEKYVSGGGKGLTGISSVLNSTFGKGGIVNTIRDLNE